MSQPKQAYQLFDCPVTGEQVLTDDWRQCTIHVGWSIWWRCPFCDEFHMLVVDITRNRDYYPLQASKNQSGRTQHGI